MRQQFAILMACAVLCGLGGPARADNGTARKPITVFVAKKIITMDPGWTTGTAVAVRDGKILSVGSLTELKPWLDSAPYTIDRRFENKVLMPGFVEAHGHPILGGILLNLPLLTYLPTVRPYGPIFQV
jgi:predicted amidohydrolase YtcJ